MSNLLNFLPTNSRIGEVIQLPWNGNTFTSAVDGSVWKAINGTPIAYSSDYSALLTEAQSVLLKGSLVNGPFSGGSWASLGSYGANYRICGNVSGTLLFLYSGATYYTSTDGGANWTSRTLPYTKSYMPLFDGTNFVLYAVLDTTDGVLESTDGITWTSRTAVSINPFVDFVYANGLYVVVGNNSTTAVTSSDRTTWTSRTTSLTPASPLSNFLTWNAGAGLWIMGRSSGYQTSPDFITWTNRTGAAGNYFASNSTTTISVSTNGSVYTTTDGINWTNRGYIADRATQPIVNNTSIRCFYDGTRFVVVFETQGFVYYSTDGITWTKSTRVAALAATGGLYKAAGGDLGFLYLTNQRLYRITDVSSTGTPDFILPYNTIPSGTTTESYIQPYMRIK